MLSSNAQLVASCACALFVIAGALFFVSKIWRGVAAPSGFAWALRALLCAIAFSAQFASGATLSLAFSGTQLLCGVAIATVAFVKGGGGRLGKVEYAACGIVAICFTVWGASGNPLYGVLCALAVDFVATAINIYGMFAQGAADSALFWLTCLAAASCGAASVGSASVLLLAPVGSMFNALAMLCAIGGVWLFRRRVMLASLVRLPRYHMAAQCAAPLCTRCSMVMA